MRSFARIAGSVTAVLVCVSGLTTDARAGSHLWDVWEVFSNADGTVQFIELHETAGATAEIGLSGHVMVTQPAGTTYTLQHNVASPTALKYYLLATAAFAALPNAPTPDEIIPANFIHAGTDVSVEYSPWDLGSWAPGALPTNGVTSLSRQVVDGAFVPSTNSPTNYAGQTGSVDASGAAALPGVPDGSTGTPVRVDKVAADGSSLAVTWDKATCSDGNDHQIVYGQRSGFPAAPGGSYTLLGGACGVGSATPFTWTPTPGAGDGSGLLWFLVVTRNASGTEGPWGSYNGINERNGNGAGGSSGVCSTTGKSLAGVCGH